MTPLKTYCLEDFSQNLLFFTYKGLKCKKKQRPARPSGHPHLSLSISSLGPVPFPFSLCLSLLVFPPSFPRRPALDCLPPGKPRLATSPSLSPGGALRRRRGTHQVRPSPSPSPFPPRCAKQSTPPPNPNANFFLCSIFRLQKADEHV